MTIRRQISLIVKATNACNMHCRYCFIEPHVFHKSMKIATARKLVRGFLDSTYFDDVRFVWHGGEPLLRGKRFFEAVVAEQRAKQSRVSYSNALQTNASLLDDVLLEFLLQNDFRLGFSLDGPAELSDAQRPFRGREPQSAHAITVAAMEKLQQRQLSAGGIVVVNAANVDHPERIYREFKDRKFNMRVNPLMKAGLANIDGTELGITAEQYGHFLVRLFDLWFDDPDPGIGIDPFNSHIRRLLDVPGASYDCQFMQSCHHGFIGISPEGDLYPCGLFQGEAAFRYGNIDELAPEDIPATALFGRIEQRERNVLDGCSQCAFFDLCYGGCMYHSLKNGNRFEAKDYFCAGYKMYFTHMVERVHGDLSRAALELERAASLLPAY